MVRVIWLLSIGTLLGPAMSAGQVIEFDAASGKHQVSYTSGYLGRSVMAYVESPNKIDPSLRLLAVEEDGGELAYHYSVSNGTGPQSRQNLVRFGLECADREVVALTPPGTWRGGIMRIDDGFECRLTERMEDRLKAIAPGHTLSGLVVRGPVLPAVGRARFWGNADDVQWPEGESMEALDVEVIDAVYRLDGITGGWVERTAVVPTRNPLELGAAGILEAVQQDVATLCEEGIWIAESLCSSLQEDLSELVGSAHEKRWSDVSQGAAELLDQVEASWKQAGGQLDSDAYWLLRLNLEGALAKLE